MTGQPDLEELPAAGEYVVQRILKMRRGAGKVTPDLIDVFFVALLDLVPEQRLERSVAQPLRVPGRVIRNDVGNQRTREPLGSQGRIPRKERVYGTALSSIAGSRGLRR
jgi:hypothetical protein